MNEEKNREIYERYLNTTHLLGRIACVIALVLLLGAPFAIGAYLGAMPDLGAMGRGFASIGLVYLVSCVAEYLIYVPMLGAGGSYLAFITGNLINMKIPCAMNARDIVGAKSGTAENEIISTLSIATSSLVTILILALGVLLLTPVLKPAFDSVLPALFGAMACKYYRHHGRIACPTVLLMAALFMLVPGLIGSTSFMIIPSGAVAIGLAWFYFRRDRAAKEAQA